MRISWDDLAEGRIAGLAGRTATIAGFGVAPLGQRRAERFVLVREPPCCPGCAPAAPQARVVIESRQPLPMDGTRLNLTGIWTTDEDGWRLREALAASPPGWPNLTRRAAMAGR